MSKPDYIIAIDPDISKSGVAYLDCKTKEVDVWSLTFPELILKVMSRGHMENMLVVVEASWLNGRHNWHGKGTDSKRISSAKGYDVGRNHEVGMLIVEICKYHNIKIEEIHPLRKCWKGRDGKITQGEIEQFIPNFPKKSNQEVRDAALIAWHVANFPIRIKPTK